MQGARMGDTEPQTAAAKVLWHFTMSLDGFVAGPEHDMHWLTGVAVRPGLIEEYTRTTGAVLAGRDGFDSAIGDARPYGGAWQGPIFVLTHHPEDARPAGGITVLSCPVEEAVQLGHVRCPRSRRAAAGKRFTRCPVPPDAPRSLPAAGVVSAHRG